MIKTLLIANRGEIAVRVIRAAKEMGICTVAVASDADVNSLHARIADRCILLGGSEPSESYLRMDKILEAARVTGADAIHPGYGFLSERADFAEACTDAGIEFVGPTPDAMRKLGAKIDAKQLATSVGVPVTPGYFEPGATLEQLSVAADEIGYPVMLKASAGGGGRGMRIVRDPSEFAQEFQIASDEALKGFGDGAMMVEKLIEQPRHIEIQILADKHGNVCALFERECSLQRRHQKLVEEAPAVVMDQFEGLWQRMRESAIQLARASGYVGAGTVEFMVDPKTGSFYFLEVNARLQVEHPVTESITGVDLVREQLRIASGEPLNLSDELMAGNRSAIKGHAIECRIVAEDASKGFMPSIGKIVGFAVPNGPGIRIDTGFEAGQEVTRFYDSLLAKCIAFGQDREHARRKSLAALADFHVLGVATNISYLIDLLSDEDFISSNFDTGFLGRKFTDWKQSEAFPDELSAIVTAASSRVVEGKEAGTQVLTAWDKSDSFRVGKG